jgi:hypothetical protein
VLGSAWSPATDQAREKLLADIAAFAGVVT